MPLRAPNIRVGRLMGGGGGGPLVGFLFGIAAVSGLAWPGRAQVVAQDSGLPRFLRDRGTGVPASIFGTYIRRGELLVYPFFEYARDQNREYQPKEFGLGPDVDFRGQFRSYAGQLFLGYGVTDWLAVEFEASVINARLEKSPRDTSAVPPVINETGVADIEGQVRARFVRERSGRPEFYGFVEITPPTQKHKLLIAEPDFDLKPGIGLIKGFSWGTLTGRIGAEYNREESKVDLGELSLEYLKRVSPRVRVLLSFEGGETGALDEWELVQGVQWQIARSLLLKVDNSLGLSSKATDWTPQIGLMFSRQP
jgi:hypothetical protein